MTYERNVKGLLGTKLGMTQLWDENNRIVPVTVVAAGTNVVTQVRTAETDGYHAIQVGYGEIEGRKVTKPSAGHFGKAGITPRRHLAEIRTADAASYQVGQELSPELFAAGDDVDVCWRLQAKKQRIGFSPSALVWHHHRPSIKAYWRQQIGYGEGEAWLEAHHPESYRTFVRDRIARPLGVDDDRVVVPDGSCPDPVDATLAADAHERRIVELGGTMVNAPEDTPYGRLATATDPVGVQFKLVQGNQGQG